MKFGRGRMLLLRRSRNGLADMVLRMKIRSQCAEQIKSILTDASPLADASPRHESNTGKGPSLI